MTTNPKIQKLVKKLISEEWIAGQIYKFYTMAMPLEIQDTLKENFDAISDDELNDHLLSLVEVAKRYEYDVPKTVAEFERFADEELVKLYKSIKADENPKYYIDQAIKSEMLAVKSYEEALSTEELDDYQEIKMVILNSYYDELDHIDTLGFMQYVDTLEIYGED